MKDQNLRGEVLATIRRVAVAEHDLEALVAAAARAVSLAPADAVHTLSALRRCGADLDALRSTCRAYVAQGEASPAMSFLADEAQQCMERCTVAKARQSAAEDTIFHALHCSVPALPHNAPRAPPLPAEDVVDAQAKSKSDAAALEAFLRVLRAPSESLALPRCETGTTPDVVPSVSVGVAAVPDSIPTRAVDVQTDAAQVVDSRTSPIAEPIRPTSDATTQYDPPSPDDGPIVVRAAESVPVAAPTAPQQAVDTSVPAQGLPSESSAATTDAAHTAPGPATDDAARTRGDELTPTAEQQPRAVEAGGTDSPKLPLPSPAELFEAAVQEKVAVLLDTKEWKQYTDKGTGKKYFVHHASKKTVWDLEKVVRSTMTPPSSS